MAHERDGSLKEALDQLSDLLFAENTLTSTLDQIAHFAVLAVRGADLAGVALIEDEYISTGGTSDELVEEIDSYQYASNEGPCLEAIRTRRVVSVDATSSETRWPRFSRKTSRKGVESVLSSPLIGQGNVIGSLNLYAFDEASFHKSDRRAIVEFADKAVMPITNASLVHSSQDQADRLQNRLDECDLISRATGILMERFQVTGREADISLRRDSNRQGRILNDIASEILSSVPKR